jgi:hypothetical protein
MYRRGRSRWLQARHDVVDVVHDALEQILRFLVVSLRLAVGQWRVVVEVEFWNVVETTHE